MKDIIKSSLEVWKADYNFKTFATSAISMASYTTYGIVMAIIHYSKSRRINNALVKELRTADLVDILVAVLTLQNTMIIASAGEITSKMKTLSIVSSSAIWLTIVILSILSFLHSLRSEN